MQNLEFKKNWGIQTRYLEAPLLRVSQYSPAENPPESTDSPNRKFGGDLKPIYITC